MAEAHCTVQITSSTFRPQKLNSDEIYMNLTDTLIMDQLNAQTFDDMTGFNTTGEVNITTTTNTTSASLDPCIYTYKTILSLRKDVHQWYLAERRTTNQVCTQGKCSVSVTETDTITYTFNVGCKITEWINAGLAVTKASAVAEGHVCDSDPG